MPPLRFHLFGQAQIEVGEEALVGFISAKAQALLIYLAMSPGRQARTRLANLLWSEFSDDQARNSLRTTLSNLNRLVGPHLTIERDAVSYNRKQPYWLDVDVVRTTFDSPLDGTQLPRWEEASALYRGGLLEGFSIRNTPVFEDWLLMQREHYHGMALRGLGRLADHCIAEGAYESGLATTRRLLLLEPWLEQSHRQQMLLLAYDGQRSAALAQYETCRSILAAEFGVQPQEETTALFQQVRNGTLPLPTPRQRARPGWMGRLRQLVQPASAPASQPSPTPLQPSIDWDSLPDAPQLVGREAEADQLTAWLTREQCRLVTLYGLGGQGKSALAATVVRSLVGPSPIADQSLENPKPEAGPSEERASFQVVLWLSLRHAPSLTEMLRTWVLFLAKRDADIPSGVDEMISLLIECLRRWRCLLVLDDVEDILHQADTTGDAAQGYREYSNFFKRIATSDHQSSLLLISAEQFQAMEQLMQSVGPRVREMRLSPLARQASRLLLRRQGIDAADGVLDCAAQRCADHPLALLETAHVTHALFSGDLAAYLAANIPITGAIHDLLGESFARLSPLGLEILSVLAAAGAPLAWSALNGALLSSPSTRELMEPQLTLLRRCLVEKEEKGIGLSALVAGYMQERRTGGGARQNYAS